MKYIILIILLLITLVLFSNYEEKFSEAEKIDSFFQDNKFLKESKSFDLNENYSFTGNYEIALSGLDLWNVRMLDQNLSGALELFIDKETMTYKDYFNKWNILLRLWVKYFNKDETKAQEYLLWAISSYNIVASNLEVDMKIKDASFENISIAMNLRNLLQIKSYIIFLAELTKKTNYIITGIKKLELVITKQIQALQQLEKWLKDESLKKCINNIKKEMVENYNWLASNESFFQKIRENLLNALEKMKNNQNVNRKYMEKKNELETRFQWSLNTMLWYFEGFQKLQWEVYDIIESKDENKLRQLCEEQKNEPEENDEDVENAYKNLSELLDQQQLEQQKEWQKSQASNSNQDMHFDMTDEQIKNYSEKIEKQNQEWIEKIEERKNSEGYEPSELLNQLFKSFLGEDRDFYNRETPDFDWTTPRNR